MNVEEQKPLEMVNLTEVVAVSHPETLPIVDMEELVNNFDMYSEPKVAVCLGHPKTDSPSYGTVNRIWLQDHPEKPGTKEMLADMSVRPEFYALRKEKVYPNRSLGFWRNFGGTGDKVLAHVGYLGVEPPELKDLRDLITYSEQTGEVTLVTFAAKDLTYMVSDLNWKLKDVAQIFAGIREWLIEKYGVDEADKVIGRYTIESVASEIPLYSDTEDGFSTFCDKLYQNHSTTTITEDLIMAEIKPAGDGKPKDAIFSEDSLTVATQRNAEILKATFADEKAELVRVHGEETNTLIQERDALKTELSDKEKLHQTALEEKDNMIAALEKEKTELSDKMVKQEISAFTAKMTSKAVAKMKPAEIDEFEKRCFSMNPEDRAFTFSLIEGREPLAHFTELSDQNVSVHPADRGKSRDNDGGLRTNEKGIYDDAPAER